MATIEFDYDPWDRKNDVALLNPGTPMGFAMVNGDLFPGRAPTVREGARNDLIGPSIQGVIELLAGSLEWCREYGLSAQDVQARVRAFMVNNRGAAGRELLKAAGRDVHAVSDPNNKLLNRGKDVVPNWRT